MILTKNSNGEWIQVAGQGKAEYGASTVRKGTITIPETTTVPYENVMVTFSTPMPDADYIVSLEIPGDSSCWHQKSIFVSTLNKTKNGFMLYVGTTDSALYAGTTVNYTAFKLYTDTEYNSLLDLPEQIEAVEDDVEAMKSETSGFATIASGLSGEVTWTKIGRLVQVRVNNIRNESGAIAGGATICTGLPVAKNTTSFAIGRYPNEANVVDLISNGELRQTGMYSVAGGIGMFGDFMYISAQ